MNHKLLRVLLVLLGVLGLVLVPSYSGPADVFVHSYGGNITFSFAAYFWVQLSGLRIAERRSWAALIVFICVSLSEIAQYLGYYSGVFDPWDFLANAVGIAIALIVDLMTRDIGTAK